MWDEITYPLPNFNGCTVEGWECISNFIPRFIIDINTYPCCKLTMLVNGGPGRRLVGREKNTVCHQSKQSVDKEHHNMQHCKVDRENLGMYSTKVAIFQAFGANQYIEAETKWLTFCRQHFQLHFLEWMNIMSDILIQISQKFVPQGQIGYITWHKVYKDLWRHVAQLGLNEFISWPCALIIIWIEIGIKTNEEGIFCLPGSLDQDWIQGLAK